MNMMIVGTIAGYAKSSMYLSICFCTQKLTSLNSQTKAERITCLVTLGKDTSWNQMLALLLRQKFKDQCLVQYLHSFLVWQQLIFLRDENWESKSLGSFSSPCFEKYVKLKYKRRNQETIFQFLMAERKKIMTFYCVPNFSSFIV